MKAIRELAAIIGEQAVAIDIGRRLLQQSVESRHAAEARADRAERELRESKKTEDALRAELKARVAELGAAAKQDTKGEVLK